MLERSEERRLSGNHLLFRVGDSVAVGLEVREEAAFLSDSVREWLVSVKNFAIVLSVIFSFVVLFAFIRVSDVTNSVEARKWLLSRSIVETSSVFWEGACCWSIVLVLELRVSDSFVASTWTKCFSVTDLTPDVTTSS